MLKKKAPDSPTPSSLILKYRPQTWEELVGQEAVVRSLTTAIRNKTRPHSFLFTGPSGTGKTTIARLIAREMKVLPENISQIDAASFSGIESVRSILSTLPFRGWGEAPRLIIMDECHSLSKPAWQALLKSIEEPPAHVFWVFCTTEPDKVPETIKTRCLAYSLKPVRPDTLAEWLEGIAESEGITLGAKLVGLIARKAEGSPRRALSFLNACAAAESKDEVLSLIDSVEQSEGAIALARLIVKGQGFGWDEARRLVEGMDEGNMEGVRLTIYNYATKALLGTQGEKQAVRLAAVLHAFSGTYNPSEGKGPLLLSIASLLFGD
jgi:DNA polymerase-3 subunit gamma/tau